MKIRDYLTIDFETRSPLDVRKVGAYVYTECPQTEILCAHINYNGRKGTFFDMDNLPSWVWDALYDEEVVIHAFNAGFERQVIKNICTPRHGWPKIPVKRFRCSAARARRMALPGALDKAGAALGVNVQKDKAGTLIMRRLSKPIKYTPDGYVYDTNPDKLIKLGQYCETDVEAELAIDDATLPMPESEERYYRLTERINDRGVRVDVDLVKQLIWRANECLEELNERITKLTDGYVRSLTEVGKIKEWIEEETGVKLPSMRKEEMDNFFDDASVYQFPKHVKDVIAIRREGAKASVSKLTAILRRVSKDGRVHGAFVFHGASTGRYTSMGVQLQNLVRDTLKDFENDILRLESFTLTEISKTLRQCFIPAKGKIFIDVDYNAIEARGVGWLAGARKLVSIYRNGGDPYCEMGTAIYGFKVTKANENERFVGKQTILGCGYGMGWRKFLAQCEKFGQPVSEEMAEKAVRTYREEFPEIPQLWRDMEKACMLAIKHPGKIFSIPNGLVSFRVMDGWLRMKLPNGRCLFYSKPRIIQEFKFDEWRDTISYMAEHPLTKQWVRETTWGGKLVENAVQAICRDLLFEAMDKLEINDIPIVLSVHDQVVCEVWKENAEEDKSLVKEIMEEVPWWAQGFPISAEPKLAKRFGK